MKLAEMKNPLATISALLLLLSVAAGCVVKHSPAPGCDKYLFGCAPMGGCFGKSVITDLKVEPAVDGLAIEVNNCNGGILEVSNACDEPFVLGGVEIGPSERNVGLDVLGKEDGRYLLTYTGSNFSDYIPEEDELIELVGTLGSQEVRVSYIKTKKLCDGEEGEDEGCFIATAAYGTETAEELDTLRHFRDEVLMTNPVGRELVELYYQVSPPPADFIAERELLRTLVREIALDPIVAILAASEGLWND